MPNVIEEDYEHKEHQHASQQSVTLRPPKKRESNTFRIKISVQQYQFMYRLPKRLFRYSLYLSVSAFLSLVSLMLPTIGVASAPLPANCAETEYPILIKVLGLRSGLGSIKAKLYGDDPDDFLVTGKKLDSKRESVNQPFTLVCLQAPQPGLYAIVVHHDENGNKKLDRNWIGIPEEGVGFSNNPELFLAVPEFKNVTFHVTDGITRLNITIQY